jgi:hypothetical protein
MADKTASDAQHAIDPDMVVVWLSRTMQIEYRSRSVYQEFWSEEALDTNSSGGVLVYLDGQSAREMLADARRMWAASSHSLRNAYRSTIQHLEDGIRDASVRRRQLEGPSPQCLHVVEQKQELWRGTKQQLAAMGIIFPGPYPGEPGGAPRRAMTQDSRGFKVWVKSAKHVWHGLFYAQVVLPEREAEERRWRARLSERRRTDAAEAARVSGLIVGRNDPAFLGFMRSIGIGG